MRIPVAYIILSLLVISCGSSKKNSSQKKHVKVLAGSETTIPANVELSPAAEIESAIPEITPEVNNVINKALSFNGTRYKYGGTTRKGMDCSGLVYVSFQSEEISLERSSSAMATQGERIGLQEVRKGDLLFFTTGRNKNRINHVGLVVDVMNDEIRFIHATTSRGVMVSSLREGYWNHAFHHARRII